MKTQSLKTIAVFLGEVWFILLIFVQEYVTDRATLAKFFKYWVHQIYQKDNESHYYPFRTYTAGTGKHWIKRKTVVPMSIEIIIQNMQTQEKN